MKKSFNFAVISILVGLMGFSCVKEKLENSAHDNYEYQDKTNSITNKSLIQNTTQNPMEIYGIQVLESIKYANQNNMQNFESIEFASDKWLTDFSEMNNILINQQPKIQFLRTSFSSQVKRILSSFFTSIEYIDKYDQIIQMAENQEIQVIKNHSLLEQEKLILLYEFSFIKHIYIALSEDGIIINNDNYAPSFQKEFKKCMRKIVNELERTVGNYAFTVFLFYADDFAIGCAIQANIRSN